MKRLLSLAVALAACVCARAVWFSSAPGSAESGQSYWVSADESPGSYSVDVYVYKNGAFFASGNGWGYASAGASSTDYGAQTVTYEAYSSWYDDLWNSYGDYTSTAVTITQPNNAPTITWTSAPASAPVNAWFNIEARGNDADGNLSNVFVWREWVPHAFAGGGNGYEQYSGNGSSSGSVGTVTFMAQSQDASGAQSQVITHTVNIYVPNVAPTVSWSTPPLGSAYVNQLFPVQAKANDGNGNLTWIYVWKDDQPFAFNAAGGAESYSDYNAAHGTNPTVPTVFKAMAGDSSGADSGFIYASTTIVNRAPTMTPTTITGPTIGWNNTYQHYTMWSGDPGIAGSGTLTMSSTLQDADANLVNHTLRYRQVTLNPNTWIQLGNDVPAGLGTSPKQATLTTVETPGQWDFNAFGHDGWTSHPGESKTVWVYGSTNAATFVSQAINGNALTGGSPTYSLNTGNNTATATILMRNTGAKPWQNPDSQFGTPHRLGAIGPTPTVWGSSVRDMSSAQIDPESFPGTNDTATFSFTFNIPQMPGNYVFQWKMMEQGVAGDPYFETATPAVTVTVIDTTPPSTSTLQLVTRTHNSVSLSWTAATDNSGAIAGYNLYRNGSLVQTLGNVLAFTDTALTPNTAYAYTVRARDAAGNLSANSNQINVTTRLTPGQDQDGDGLPNEWEEDNGLNPLASDAESDPDHDGLTNSAEYNLGKNPNVYDQGSGTVGGAPGGWPNGNANPGLAVGATVGSLAVDKNGAATYSVALWTTPGTAGMQPQLALNYSSQGGAGIAGFGWSVGGVSAITRGPKTKAIDGANKGVTVTADDRFYLDGQRLILVGSGNYGDAGTEYRTELESFTKVVANGSAGSGPASFTAWTKAGLIIQFGQTADSAFDAWGKSEKLAWHVNRISDTKGNYMDFVYSEDAANGVHRLDRINYTGNTTAATTPYASVRFEYEDRPDPISGYVAGSPVASLKRLKYVRSHYGETVARTYTLDYTPAARNNRSQLTSLTETGSDGKSYPPLAFEYEPNVEGWDDGTAFLPEYYLADNSNSGRPAGSGFIDFDGDGRTDFVARREGAGINYAYRNTGSGWTSDSNYLLPYQLAENANADDQGSRFADLNSDGLVDYIARKYDYGNTEVNEAWLNQGGTWVPASQWWAPALIYRDGTINDYPLRGAKFLDINGDGRVDFVGHLGSGGSLVNLIVHLNTGSGWDGTHTGYSSLPNFPDNDLPKYKPRFIDLNGDGLPDLAVHYVYGGTTRNRVWINNGSGWTESTDYQLPKPIATDTNPGPGAEFADVNGDGLPDLLWYRELSGGGADRGVALNTGAGWIQNTDIFNRYAPHQPLSRDNETSAGSAFIDLNADGITDYVFSRQFTGQSAQKAIYYGNLKEWGYAGSGAEHELPHLLLQGGVNQPGADFVDLNGDGVVDVLWKRKHADNSTFADARLNRAKPINGRLKKVTNGFGVEASVAYGSLMDSAVYEKGTGGPADSVNLIGPMWVVKSLTHDDGVGGQYAIDYKYGGLRSDILRGSLGFAWLRSTDSRTGLASQSNFRQEYPFIGMVASAETKTSGGTVLSASSFTYGEKLLNGGTTHFIFAQTSTETTRDLDNSVINTTTTTVPAPSTDIDDYGNIRKLVVDNEGFKKTTDSVYTNDTANWFLGRLTSSTVTSEMPSGYGQAPVTRKSTFTYNASNGLLETETVEPDDAKLKLTTAYGYDNFGNKSSVAVSGADITVTDASGTLSVGATVTRTTSTQYDSAGRFPVWTENALGHRENYIAYDQARGVLTGMTGANDLPTSWGYDGFGRKTSETRADGTHSYTDYRWVNSLPAGAATYPGGTSPTVKYSVETTADGAPPSLVFHDKFGRAFLGLGVTGDGLISYQATTFDAMGRPYAKSNPYFNNGSPIYWSVTTQFDLLDRPKTVTTPDEQNGPQTTSSSYAGRTVTVADAKGRVAKTVKNPAGWTTENVRNDNAGPGALDYSRVTYDYDPLGNLLKTTAAGVQTTLEYDLRGRKTKMTDADMGAWHYRYNIFGELIWQKDAKGQITRLTYDNLGRLVTRIERNDTNTADETTTWIYDTSPKPGGGVWKGKLHTVAAPGSYAENYTYDSLGRSASVTRTPDAGSGSFTVSTGYDSFSRPNRVIYPATGLTTNPFSVRHVYSNLGYLKEIRFWLDSDNAKPLSQLEGKLYWQADHFSASGRIDGETYGNGLANDRVYSDASGRLLSASIDRGINATGPYLVQQLAYTYDSVGNVTRRYDSTPGYVRDELFYTTNPGDGYDGLDRLKIHRIVGGATVNVAYDQKGNITSKSDVGSYSYVGYGPHAVSTAGTNAYTYDANGNMLAGASRTHTWTSFNQLRKVTTGSVSSEFFFDAAHQRVKQIRKNGATTTDVTFYIGSLYEKVVAGATTEHKHYILGPTGRVAVHTDRSTLTKDTRFFHTDGLGSITVISDEAGRVLKRYAYDAWGKQETRYTNTGSGITNQAPSTRGFTDHEMLADHNLTHMNGRVYDPVLSRFLSADPNIDGAEDAQGYNRYSYVDNNPLGATDPTGFFKLKDILPAVIAIVVTVVTYGAASAWATTWLYANTSMFMSTAITTGSIVGGAIAGTAAGFASGFAGSLLNGGSIGDAFKAGAIGGAIGAISGALTSGIGAKFGAVSNSFGHEMGRALAHGAVGGAIEEATGGQFRHGFYAGFAGSVAGSLTPHLGLPSYENGSASAVATRTTVAAVAGGTASALGGGKFVNGAVTAAFQHLLNAEAHRGWWQKFKDGVYFGTGFGEDAAQYYADITLDSNASWYAKAGAYAGGTVSSLWMRDTYLGTATTLIPTGGAIFTVEQTAARRIGVEVSRSNFVKDKLFRWGYGKWGKQANEAFHFHLAPAMKHHLPAQFKTWYYHSKAIVSGWFK